MTSSRPRTIGIKSVAAIALAAILFALGAARHATDANYLAHLSGGACFLIGLVASLAVALIGIGWRFGVRSITGLAFVRGRPVVMSGDATRELPGMVQRLVLLVVHAQSERGVIAGDAKQAQSDHQHAGDRAAAERDLERRVDA